jgi:Spy/CpxP family protein refolding chaperone
VSPWKVILATMIIFGCGVVTGGLLIKTEFPSATTPVEAAQHPSTASNQPPPLNQFQRPEFLHRMQKQLDLTASQTNEITRIMKASQERNRPLWEEIAPQLRQEVKRVREEIRETLTPDQQKKFDELLKARPRKADGTGAPAGRAAHPAPEPSRQTNAL